MKKLLLLLIVTLSLHADTICIEEEPGTLFCIDEDGNTSWIFIEQ